LKLRWHGKDPFQPRFSRPGRGRPEHRTLAQPGVMRQESGRFGPHFSGLIPPRPRAAGWAARQATARRPGRAKNQGGASDPTGASCHGRAGQGQGDRTSGIKSEAPPVIGLGCRDVSAATPEISCILRAKVSSDRRRGRGGLVLGKNVLIPVRGWSRSRSPTG